MGFEILFLNCTNTLIPAKGLPGSPCDVIELSGDALGGLGCVVGPLWPHFGEEMAEGRALFTSWVWVAAIHRAHSSGFIWQVQDWGCCCVGSSTKRLPSAGCTNELPFSGRPARNPLCNGRGNAFLPRPLRLCGCTLQVCPFIPRSGVEANSCTCVRNRTRAILTPATVTRRGARGGKCAASSASDADSIQGGLGAGGT